MEEIEALPPAFLISQKSEIFDCFPPGGSLGRACANAINYNLSYEILTDLRMALMAPFSRRET